MHGIRHRIGSGFHWILHFSGHERQMRAVRAVDDDNNTAFMCDITDRLQIVQRSEISRISDQKSFRFGIIIQTFDDAFHGDAVRNTESQIHFRLNEDRLCTAQDQPTHH